MKKSKMKVLSLLLVLFLLTQCVVGYASQQMNNFQKVRTYSPEIFNDIASADWFYQEVANSYCYGITSGVGENKFSPYGLVSIAEAITFAVRVHCIYNSNTPPTPVSGQEWYMANVDYAIKNGIIKEELFKNEYERPATRSEMGYIFAKSLPYTEFENINTKIESIPDMTATVSYYNEIIMLYRAGVVTGKDQYGTFSPTENITRAESSAILNRIVDPTQRKSFVPADMPNTTTQPTPTSTSAPTKMDAVAIAKTAGPSVFRIEIYDKTGEAVATGSGFFIETSGVAVTNYHVIEDAYTAAAFTSDGKKYDISLVYGYDKVKDVAIIQVVGSSFPALKLGNSDEIQNGQKIFCVGSPLGLDNSISEGVVSNSKRTIDDMTYIQISAPISHGSSGGAVLDEQCQVIGISSAGFVEGQNLNLAIPSNIIPTIARDSGTTLAKLFPGTTDTATIPANTSAYYTENNLVPNYTYVTGKTALGRTENANPHTVSYVYPPVVDDFKKYVAALLKDGYTLYEKKESTNAYSYYYTKGEQMLLLTATYNPDAVLLTFFYSDYYSGSTSSSTITYYPEAPLAPDYQSVTGARLISQEKGTTIDSYMYVYSYNENQVSTYFKVLKEKGFTLYATKENTEYDYIMYAYVKGRTMVSVAVSASSKEVFVIPMII